jgi:putative flippase GtrA
VPVDWVDDPDSRVDVVATAATDLKGVARLLGSFARGGGSMAHPLVRRQPVGRRSLGELAVRFASIGTVSTVLFAALFLLAVSQLGALWADVLALTTCSVANTAANRRLTFALAGRSERFRQHRRALVVSLLPLGLNLAAVLGAGVQGVTSVWAVLVTLVAVNLAAGAIRFVLLDRWVFLDRGQS